MNLSAAVIDALVASGATVEQLAAAMKAALAETEQAKTTRRAKDAERQQRSRANRKAAVSRDVTVTPRDTCDAPPNDIYSNPPELSPDASHPPRAARRASAFPRPDWADEQVWSDFLANRKRKGLSNTVTAHRKLLADIARIADAAWPPGRLLEAATARGWGAIYPSIKDDRDAQVQRDHRTAPRTGDGFSNALRQMSGDHPAHL
ncbi:hypothetical protein [Sphingomonas sp. Leaf257]|uniref:hypothetical protein n=1 Tax=Sphingomonas sp. Leaf257 TaxID=1736309 RepID=UPI0006F49A0F|nr:hypothetical protein [Sphingomonas sp. Leaf257]KQO50633.1 hypothetical protein ASF14_11145 [Sphingomonas sp. Leaf257]